ncbi:hypothetical protein HYG82_21810 (plasmid) [Natrinema halophilum]|nr:hypothetical protein HYG82_21810 [Natrinema halophilum]
MTKRNYEELLDLSFAETEQLDEELGGLELTFSYPGIELIAPGDDDSPIAKYIDENGPGQYAVVFRVADLAAAKDELSAKDVTPIIEVDESEAPEAFYHPKDFDGVMVILTEYSHPHGE